MANNISPDWFKTKKEWNTLIKMLDRYAKGTAFELAMDYMETMEVPAEVQLLDPLTLAAFNFMKKSIDDASAECVNISEICRAAALARWGKERDAKDAKA